MPKQRDHDAETSAERIGGARFLEAVWAVIDYHVSEYYVSTAEIVGNLDAIKHDVMHQLRAKVGLDCSGEADDEEEAWKGG